MKWQEIFRFELIYRLRRPETYLFFVFLFGVSIFGVDFILEGVELGLVKKNAPLVIGKTMGALTGLFMILASIVMGMPIIRDDSYQVTSLMYTQPVEKIDLLAGRFIGSFLVLILIFTGIPLGMIVGEFMPWHHSDELLPFRLSSYLNAFTIVLFPTIFFGAALFYVSGFLSRKLLVVYTQGIVIFVLFILTKSITDENLQALLDPFSLTTISQISKDWTITDKNTLLLPFSGILLANKMFWAGSGLLILAFGYLKFDFRIEQKNPRKENVFTSKDNRTNIKKISILFFTAQYDLSASWIQFWHLSAFYFKSLFKVTSFWAIVICGVIIIVINSISLGTVYGVNSYPSTFLIIEELQELSTYFFIIILLFYSAELYWKERSVNIQQLTDISPSTSLVNIMGKVAGLNGIFVVLFLALIASGIVFQLSNQYYHLDLSIYFSGFFIEMLPFLFIYTSAAFFIQAIVNNKFLGIIITLVFFISSIAISNLGYGHLLINFGGGGLSPYSEMNGYGHFMVPYLWEKMYWICFGLLLIILGSLVAARGLEEGIKQRIKRISSNSTKSIAISSLVLCLCLIGIGIYLQFQCNVLNETWSLKKQQKYRAQYEKSLKHLEYFPQPKLISTDLFMEIYPDQRSYFLSGSYVLRNDESFALSEIHIQKQINNHVNLSDVSFSIPSTLDTQFQKFDYFIYKLNKQLLPGDSVVMEFKQSLKPIGFEVNSSIGSVLYNGTFIRNNEFPTFGYNNKYELRDDLERKHQNLESRKDKADLNHKHELQHARSGSDSNGIVTNIIIGTKGDQIAVTSGKLVNQWTENEREYFHYKSTKSIINFYAINSGEFKIFKDHWVAPDQSVIKLEIYHHQRHNYNLERMMKSMKASLDYYSTYFSPYQYSQLRIVEFPRYEQFAQSFPNTIPFSESIGFMLNIDDSTDVDMTFFVTAHEVAHQWWGMQLETANVKGRNFVLETLSQYSALMVLKKTIGQKKAEQFLEDQKERYELGEKKSKIEEAPLYLVENEEYIYYNKGVLVMNELQEIIGEANVNHALQAFLKDWNSNDGILKSNTKRFATSEDLIGYFLTFSKEENRNEVLQLFGK